MTPERRAATLEKLLSMPSLPSPSPAALKLLAMTQDEKVSLRELTQAIQADPAFVARLLQVANSARIGPGRPVVAVQDALMLLGLPTIRGLAVGFSLLDQNRSSPCGGLDSEAFWRHTLAVAVAFEATASSIKAASADEAFTIGLLANIGTLALAAGVPERFEPMLAEARADSAKRLEQLETEAFGFNHWELSSELLSRWGMPDVYTRPVEYQALAPAKPRLEGRAANLTAALALAVGLADCMFTPRLQTREQLANLYVLGARISLDPDAVVGLGKELSGELARWGGILGVEIPVSAGFEWAEAAHRSNAGAIVAEPQDGVRLNVLVVDDEPVSRTLLEHVLTASDFQVTLASSAREALELVRNRHPDLVVTDWIMPDMDGLELIRQLRAMDWAAGIYILVITTNSGDQHLVTALEAGASDFVPKPINRQVLVSRLRAAERVTRLQRDKERRYHEMCELAEELSVTNRKLLEVSVTDSLTGCRNRRYALERLQQEWSAAERRDAPLSCLFIDLDRFKQVNDLYGHDRGDEVLRIIANALRAAVRAEDVVCRMGGDEFLIICPDTTLAAATACAERICNAVRDLDIKVGNKYCTASIGVAERSKDIAGPEVLIERADRDLYHLKREGRGKTGRGLWSILSK